MRIVLHDYPGHAFPVQLSRALAARGHAVLHLWFSGFQSPRGPLERRPDDPPGLELRPLSLGGTFEKYDFVRRWKTERAYGRLLADAVIAWKPDVVFGGNAPLDPQAILQAACRRAGIGFAFWLQDVYGVAIDAILRRKLPVVGAAVGAWYRSLEKRLWRASDAVVAITEDFRPVLSAAGVAPERVFVIENWAALDDLPLRPRDNGWAARHDLAGRTVLLYSGTMGLKHNPELLAVLARRFRDRPDVSVVVVSEGIGADHLARAKAAEGLDNLLLLPFQPHAELPEVVASADVLVVVLEADAGVYSVPSKLLTYLCAGRAVLGAIPTGNLAARIIAREGVGRVVAPDDTAGFAAAAEALLADPAARAAAGRAARAYAERTFDIAAIADRFETILAGVRAAGGERAREPV